MISIKIEAMLIFEPEQVRIQKYIDKEDFGRKGLFGADSINENRILVCQFRLYPVSRYESRTFSRFIYICAEKCDILYEIL
ncbi:MAG: hypothetical protein JJU02_10265 [Cryomorphaceae bacterium]|nr:hypothetical protein [Cryomorphaceae bacterium]